MNLVADISPQVKAMSPEQVLGAIHQWGVERNIIGEGKSQAQFLKLVEEYSEYEGAFNLAEVRDGIGDTVVVLVMIAGIEGFTIPAHGWTIVDDGPVRNPNMMVIFGNLAAAISRNNVPQIEVQSNNLMAMLNDLAFVNGVDFIDCVREAYDEIKDRKGILLDGIFIKSTDPRYDDAVATVEKRKGGMTTEMLVHAVTDGKY
jgi:hypothetical protein